MRRDGGTIQGMPQVDNKHNHQDYQSRRARANQLGGDDLGGRPQR